MLWQVVADCSIHHSEISLVSDWCPNLSFMSRMQIQQQTWIQNSFSPAPVFNPNHTYLAVLNSDGDNMQVSHRVLCNCLVCVAWSSIQADNYYSIWKMTQFEVAWLLRLDRISILLLLCACKVCVYQRCPRVLTLITRVLHWHAFQLVSEASFWIWHLLLCLFAYNSMIVVLDRHYV